jgi:hypothetical protein
MRSTSSRAAKIIRPQRQVGSLAASVESEPANLFVVVVVVKVTALIVKTSLALRFMTILRATVDWLRGLHR